MPDVSHLYRIVQDQRTGKILSGVTVTLCEPNSSTPIADLIYSDEGLTQQLPNPFVSNSGVIDVYLARPRNISLQTTYGLATTIADNIQVLPHAEFLLATPVPVTIVNGPGTNTFLAGIDSETLQFVSMDDLYMPNVFVLVGWVVSGALSLVSVTRDTQGTITTGLIGWPNGIPGTYTTDQLSTDFPGKVDAYHVTYDDPVRYTFTQPLVTRDATGDIIAQPPIQVT